MSMSADRLGAPEASAENVVVALLGATAVGGLVLAGARARVLLATLAMRPGGTRSPQYLIDVVWGDGAPRAPMNALHTQVSRLRSVLPDGVLENGPAGYRLAVPEDRIDLTLARRLSGRARELCSAAAHQEALAVVAQARALWRGEPGADLPPGPVADELSDLAALAWRALDDVELSAREALGDREPAIAIAERIASAEGLNEPAHAVLMRLLAAAGRPHQALEVFAALRQRLATELGADPGPALVELNTAILRGEPLEVPRGSTPLAVAPPAVAATPAAIGLRAAPNALFGREADLKALAELVQTSRVTTVVGPGGTGKTRVANELGLRWAGRSPVVLVELVSVGPTSDRERARTDVAAAISATLGIGEVPRDSTGLRVGSMDLRRRLHDALAARPMLLILDNCEHVIDAVAAVVTDLVASCGRLTVLATSRAALEIAAEAVYPLSPLAVDPHGSPATELFAARARAARPSVRLEPAAVARLCRTLDGLPLAIELAAARTRTMSLAEIESRLDDRFALLRGGDRSSPQRHRTLHAVIEWSWNLLDEPQRVALRRLCRFPAGTTLAAAEFLLAEDAVGDVVTVVDGLVGQSLLSVVDDEDGAVRYRMLETVREFGEQQLQRTGEADLTMRRICCWAREFVVDAVRRRSAGDWLAVALEIDAEEDNLTAVLRHAVDQADAQTVYTVFPMVGALWMMRGHHEEVIEWSRSIVALPPPPQPQPPLSDLQVFANILMAVHLGIHGMSDGRPPLRTEAIIRARVRRLMSSGALDPPARYWGALLCTRLTVGGVGRKLVAGAHSSDLAIRSSALTLRAQLRENAGDIELSRRDAMRVLECRPNRWLAATMCSHLGQLSGQCAQYRQAVVYFRRAVEGLHELRAFDAAVELRSFLATALIGTGELAQARRELESVASYVADDSNLEAPDVRRAIILGAWSDLALADGDIDVGLARARRSLELLGRAAMHGGDKMSAAAVLDAHVLYDALAEVPDLAVGVATLGFDQTPVWDLPQLGAVACALGSYLLAVERFPDIGRELLVLAARVSARQDRPVMLLSRHLALHRSATTDALMAEPRQKVARMGRRRAAERIVALAQELRLLTQPQA